MSRRRRKSVGVDENSTGPVLIPIDLLHLAAEVGSEDGSDPKDFHAKPWNAPRKATRKGQQLCAQVKCALHTSLAGCAYEVLQAASVVSVEPAPHTGRLLVLVSAGETDRAALEAALIRATGFLRTEAAEAICRRHAPELVFEVL